MGSLEVRENIDWKKYTLPLQELEKIRSAASTAQLMKDLSFGARAREGMFLPWDVTHSMVRFAPGHVTVWTGKTFSGKTQLLKQAILHAIAQQGQRACIASMEETPEETFLDICRMAVVAEAPNGQEIDAFCDWVDDRLYTYDQQRLVKPHRLLGLLGFAATDLRCTQLVIDSWMRMDMASDDYDQQRVFMNHLMAHAEYYKLHVHIVAHQKKRDGKDKNLPGDGDDIKGSGDIQNQAHKIAVVWRNRTPPFERPGGVGGGEPDGMLIIDKQRGRPNWLGKIKLWHDQASGQFRNEQFAKPVVYVPHLPGREQQFNGQRGLEV
jgi:twinkle protein